jgi:hypothetical protein
MTSSAVIINLTSDKTEMKINDTITFHLEVRDAGFTGGAFTVRIEDENNTWKNVRTSFSSSCTMCKGGRDMEDLKEDPSFIPLKAGTYRADATYGGMNRSIEFTVSPITSTTTSTSSTTTTTTSTTTTTTTSTTTTTLHAPHDQSSSMMLYVFGIILVATIGLLLHAKK